MNKDNTTKTLVTEIFLAIRKDHGSITKWAKLNGWTIDQVSAAKKRWIIPQRTGIPSGKTLQILIKMSRLINKPIIPGLSNSFPTPLKKKK